MGWQEVEISGLRPEGTPRNKRGTGPRPKGPGQAPTGAGTGPHRSRGKPALQSLQPLEFGAGEALLLCRLTLNDCLSSICSNYQLLLLNNLIETEKPLSLASGSHSHPSWIRWIYHRILCHGSTELC
jgi:hypothetical protein